MDLAHRAILVYAPLSLLLKLGGRLSAGAERQILLEPAEPSEARPYRLLIVKRRLTLGGSYLLKYPGVVSATIHRFNDARAAQRRY